MIQRTISISTTVMDIFTETKHYEKAIEKFIKQVELAPRRANPYDSLGDAYLAGGYQQKQLRHIKSFSN